MEQLFQGPSDDEDNAMWKAGVGSCLDLDHIKRTFIAETSATTCRNEDALFLTAVLEYLAREILEVSSAKAAEAAVLVPDHIVMGISSDPELNALIPTASTTPPTTGVECYTSCPEGFDLMLKELLFRSTSLSKEARSVMNHIIATLFRRLREEVEATQNSTTTPQRAFTSTSIVAATSALLAGGALESMAIREGRRAVNIYTREIGVVTSGEYGAGAASAADL